jgi:hypothetical protein
VSSSQGSAGRTGRTGSLLTLGCAGHEVDSEELAEALPAAQILSSDDYGDIVRGTVTGSEGVDLVAEAIGATASQPPAPAGMR